MIPILPKELRNGKFLGQHKLRLGDILGRGKPRIEGVMENPSMERRTRKVALVGSRSHKVYKTKQSHSQQLRWLPVSHDTLVQEKNYLSQSTHIWQGDIAAHMVRAAMFAEWDHPYIAGLLGKFHTYQWRCQAEQPCTSHRLLGKFHTWHQGWQDIYQKDPEGCSTPLSRYN